MKRFRHVVRAALLLIVVGSAVLSSIGQPPPSLPLPRFEFLTPMGGKQGTTVEVILNGTDLEDPSALIFSHPGIKAELVPLPAPPAVDPKKAAPPPMPAGPRKFKVTIAPDVPLGNHDARLVNTFGISNPRVFVVGDLEELAEVEPNNDVPQAQKIPLGTTVNGTLSAGTDVDFYSVSGKKGQRLLVSCATTSIDSRSRPQVEIFDISGKRLASNRNYLQGDALADVTLPADADYLVRVTEYTYTQGGPHYFYRLNIGLFSWIDAVHPPMIEPGKTAPITIYGRNLPGGQLDPTALVDGIALEKVVVNVTAPASPEAATQLNFSGRIEPSMSMIDGFDYRIKGAHGSSNPALFTFARAPVVLENDGNDTFETAQLVPALCEIAGRVDRKFDRDWYAIECKKGDAFIIDLFADRIGTPSDFFLRVINAMKQDIHEADDQPDVMAPLQFYARTSDPQAFSFTAPADGKYYIYVGSREANYLAGPRISYRLSIVPVVPDFRLIVMPTEASHWSTNLVRPDSEGSFDVFVWRQNGFAGPITLTMEGLPAGVTCPPQTLMGDQKQTALVITAAPGTAAATVFPTVKGTATIADKPIIRQARPASHTWATQPGTPIPAIVRLDRALPLAVRDTALFRVTITPSSGEIKQGEKLTVKVNAIRQRPDLKVPVIVTLVSPPNANLTVNGNQPVTIPADKNDLDVVIQSTAALPPGEYRLSLRSAAAFPFNKDPNAKMKANVTAIVPILPLVVKVMPTALGKLTVAANPNNFKVGMMGDVIIRVERLHGFTGEYKVKLVFPPEIKGVSADEVTIPTGQTDAKMVVKIAPNAAPGARNNITAVVTGMYEGKLAIAHEIKFNINVVP